MRMGRVFLSSGYAVDLDNQEMVNKAKVCLFEDVHNAVKTAEVGHWIDTEESPDLSEKDIPEFLVEGDEDEKAKDPV